MCIVKHAKAIGIECQYPLQRPGKAGWRLQGQAIDQVDADRAEALFTGACHQAENHLFVLYPVNPFLHRFIEILHAHAQTIESQRSQVINHIQLNFTGINLDRHFNIVGHAEVLLQ